MGLESKWHGIVHIHIIKPSWPPNQGRCSLQTIENVLWLMLAPDLFPRNSVGVGCCLAWAKTAMRKM